MNGKNSGEVSQPIDPVTGKALLPRKQPGYYPGFRTLDQQTAWDARTRSVVLNRVTNVPRVQYFDAEAERFWTTVFDHLIPQTDRVPASRIPIVNVVDDRLGANRSIGYRFDDMPPDREAYELGRTAIDEEARTMHGAPLVELGFPEREAVLKSIHGGEPRSAPEIWHRMSVHRFWQLIVNDAVDAYYAHPWAWDEIGFGGPAYPRAYMRLENGDPEPWEVAERRYSWDTPPGALSGETEEAHQFDTEAEQHSSHSPKEPQA